MPDDPKRKARKAVCAAQKQFERESSATNTLRRKAFAEAKKEGLSLREIGEEVGLTHSRDPLALDGLLSRVPPHLRLASLRGRSQREAGSRLAGSR